MNNIYIVDGRCIDISQVIICTYRITPNSWSLLGATSIFLYIQFTQIIYVCTCILSCYICTRNNAINTLYIPRHSIQNPRRQGNVYTRITFVKFSAVYDKILQPFILTQFLIYFFSLTAKISFAVAVIRFGAIRDVVLT